MVEQFLLLYRFKVAQKTHYLCSDLSGVQLGVDRCINFQLPSAFCADVNRLRPIRNINAQST